MTTARALNILLVLPEWRMTTNRWKLGDHPYINKKAFVPPLSLATIAALTPAEHHVDIWDESVNGLIDDHTRFERQYDLVGVGGYVTYIFRAREVGRIFRSRGIPVVIGGAGVTASPESYRDHFDVLVLGESERIWPQFLQEFVEGRHQAEYHDHDTVEMAASPAPDWRSVADGMARNYAVGAVQTTRGCPFICEFCNVWKVFGRTMRTKSIPQVIEEVTALHRLGMRVVSFCEDNFYGDRRYCKALLRELIALNATFDEPLRFYAEISINIASDNEVLELLSEARFAGLFIGIESPNVESLKETAKVQNLKGDLVETCRKIQSYGLPIEGSMIVGFDHDDLTIFDQQFDFFEAANITFPRVRMLQARPGTDTFDKMIEQNRVLDVDALHEPGTYFDNYLIPNILPASMTRLELFDRYVPLMEKTLDWDSFTGRVLRYLELITYEPAKRRAAEGESREMPQDLRDYVASLDDNVRENVIEILSYAAAHAPEQMHNVVTLIVRHSIEVDNLPQTRATVQRQIAFERGKDLSGCLYKRKAGSGALFPSAVSTAAPAAQV
ncbi:MAG: B12-binding domain-containing radical SAM protein [Acidobacteriota bacterium]|nr:B12-binding domain-containing radical SAM protein [Acidobacteriota bacterium]